jgi:hypothetical protein
MREREARPGGCERIELRRRGTASISTERIGAQRVDCDQEDVLVARHPNGERRRTTPTCGDDAGTGERHDGKRSGRASHVNRARDPGA